MNNNELGKEGMELLASSERLKNLKRLQLNNTKISEEGMLALSTSEVFKSLTHLDISHNNLNIEGTQLLSIGQIRNLTFLNISHNLIGEQGCISLSDSESFPLVSELVVMMGNGLNNESKKFLHRSNKLRSLAYIN
jgi:Ran GTPase-activating protein (RanGAP) involved in mRNA processing and transport